MKRWIHAATENIDQKIKDYLAAWAHDNVKAGKEACSLKDFREQLKQEGLKYSDSRYDYYLQCYNHMNGAKTGSKKKVNSNTSTRDRISYLEDRIDSLKQYVDECKAEGCDLDDFIDELQEIEELKEQLNFAWQDDEAEWNYAREQQEFNTDGSLKYYGSTCTSGKKRINANAQIGTYRGVPYGIEDDDNVYYYFIDKSGKVHYADLEDELFAKIDKMLGKPAVEASTMWDNGWSKRYDSETDQTYFVFSCPKATGYVTVNRDKDESGRYTSEAEVKFRDGSVQNKMFFDAGSEFDAMSWAEKMIFTEC